MDKKTKKRAGGATAVVAVRPDGEPAGFFDAIIDATRTCGVSYEGIRRCLRGKTRTCRGLMWYKEPDFREAYITRPESLRFDPDKCRTSDGRFAKGAKVRLGRSWSDESRRRQSEKVKAAFASGRRKPSTVGHPAWNRQAVVETKTGRCWPTMTACAKDIGVTPCAVSYAVRRGSKVMTTGCHYWKKAEYDRVFGNKETKW